MNEPSSAERIHAAARVSQFLKDDAISGALGRMERRYYEEFIVASSSELRVQAWAKANMLRDFTREMQSVLDAGEIEVLTAAKAQATRTPQER